MIYCIVYTIMFCALPKYPSCLPFTFSSTVSVVELEYAEYAVNESAENERDNTFAVCLVFINECECPVDFIVYLSVSSSAALFGKLL